MRGLAACAIVLLHAGLYSATFGHGGDKAEIWRHLNSAVPVFFVLSGFLLYSPFAAAHAEGRAAPRFASYAMRRALRIFPGYWTVLIVSMIVFGVFSVNSIAPSHPDSFPRALSWFGLFAQWGHMADRSLRTVPQAWTLDIEFAFYLVLPLIAAGVGLLIARSGRSYWLKAELAGIGLFALISILFKLVGASQGGYVTASVTYISWPVSYFDGFAIGMLLAVIALHRDRGGMLPKAADLLLSPFVLWGAWLMVLVGAVAFLRADDALSAADIWGGKRFLAEYVAYIGIGALLVAPLILGGRGTHTIRRALSHRATLALGTISYGIYLWHFFVFDVIKAAGFDAAGGMKSYAEWSVVGLAGSAAIAAVSWRLIEQPALRLKRHFPLGEKPATPAPLAVPAPATSG